MKKENEAGLSREDTNVDGEELAEPAEETAMDMDEALWSKTNTSSVEKKPAAELEEEDIKIDCKRELDRYLNSPG